MGAFVVWENYIIDKKERALKPSDLKAVRFDVTEVYEGSPAFYAGVRSGFLFIPRNKYHSEDSDLMEKFTPGSHVLKFVDPEGGKFIEIKAQGYLHGFSLRRNVQAACRDLGFLDHYSDDIIELVHEDSNDALEDIAQALVAPQKPGLFSFIKRDVAIGHYDPLERQDYLVNGIISLFAALKYYRLKFRLMGKHPMQLRPNVMDLIMAVYFAEQRKTEEARSFLEAFEEDGEGYASLVYSLYHYVHALLIEQEEGDEEEMQSRLAAAFEVYPTSKRVIRKIRECGGEVEEEADNASMAPFPLSYVLMRWDPLQETPNAVQLVSLKGTLDKLEDDQFLTLVSMGAYRSNGYYSRMMNMMGLMHRQFGRHFPRLHVVTSYDSEDGVHHDEWLLGERYALGCRVRIEVLFDPEYLISELVGSTSAPHCVIINKQGYVVYRGSLGAEKGYWKALNSIGQTPEDDSGVSVLSGYA